MKKFIYNNIDLLKILIIPIILLINLWILILFETPAILIILFEIISIPMVILILKNNIYKIENLYNNYRIIIYFNNGENKTYQIKYNTLYIFKFKISNINLEYRKIINRNTIEIISYNCIINLEYYKKYNNFNTITEFTLFIIDQYNLNSNDIHNINYYNTLPYFTNIDINEIKNKIRLNTLKKYEKNYI